jgi:hypothetical protein
MGFALRSDGEAAAQARRDVRPVGRQRRVDQEAVRCRRRAQRTHSADSIDSGKQRMLPQRYHCWGTLQYSEYCTIVYCGVHVGRIAPLGYSIHSKAVRQRQQRCASCRSARGRQHDGAAGDESKAVGGDPSRCGLRRFVTYASETAPVIAAFEAKGKARHRPVWLYCAYL